MSERLFKRNAALIISRVDEDNFNRTTTSVRITDLRVAFSIEKNLGKDPNPCTVTVYNLSPATRAELQHKPLHVRLEAGYDGNFERVFSGDLTWCQSALVGVDWVTKMQLGDGERAIRYARVNRSYKSGTDAKTVLKDIAGSMGFKMPADFEAAAELAKQFVSGLSISGPSEKEMTRVTRSKGLDWSVQDGTLQFLRKDGVRPDEALVISQDTGMIGTPEYGAPEKSAKAKAKEKAAPSLTVKTLLKPSVTPGAKILVRSRSMNGLFKVQRVVHTGDTFGTDAWTSEIEATPV